MKEELWQRKRVKSSETAGKMVFFGLSQAKQIQRSKNKTNTTQTSKKKKGQTRRRTTRTQKKAGNKHRIRTQLAAANLPPKRALEGNPVAAFSA